MRQTFNPIHLLAEILLIVVLAQVAVMLALPVLAPDSADQTRMLLGVALLVLLAAPTVYWRSMVAAGRAPRVPVSKSQGNRSLGWAVVMTAAAQLLGLALTAAAVVWQRSSIEEDARLKFDRGAERIEAEVKRRLDQPLYGLMGARGMFAAAGAVDRSAFRAYVESRDLNEEFRGVRGFGFVERVMRSDLARFVAAARADHAPDFAVRSSGDAPDLFVVKYIEPLAKNREALGFDLGQEAVRREAVERAVSSGAPTLTARIALVQDGRQGAGFIYIVPVYRRGAALDTLRRRQDALVGLLSAPIVLSEIMVGVRDAADGLLEFKLFDGSTAQANELVFGAIDPLSGPQGDMSKGLFGGRSFESSRGFVVGGRKLVLRIATTPAFDAAMDRSSLAIVGLSGTLASVLLALTVWLLAVGRVRAQRRAERMTADLDRLAKVVQHTTNAVVLSDPQLRITWVNEAFTKISGYTLAESQGRTPGELLANPDADPAAAQALLDAGAAGEACRVEVLNRAKDGREYWIETEIQPTRDAQGVLTGFMEIGADITARKEAEQARRAVESELRTMLDVFPGYIARTSEDFHFEYANQRFAALFGLSPEQVIGRHARDLLGEAAYEATRKRREQIVASGQPISFERHVESPSGGKGLDLLMTHFMVESARLDGRRKFYQFAIDISERKRAERALAAREAELSAARDEAERANRAKSDFLSSMSHELRTPMNAILGFGQLMEFDKTLPDEHQENLREILKAGHHLLELINEVLDLARVESGRVDLSLEPVELRPLVGECLGLVSTLADKRAIRISHSCPPGVAVRADRTRLKQALLNLLSNAIKYNRESGSVTLTFEPCDGDRLRIRITDTGPGIPAARFVELFQPFYRLGAENSEIEGTGIGLTITRRIVELMGGTVDVESQLGVGSTFWIELPSESLPGPDHVDETTDLVDVPAVQNGDAAQHTVLYIEDNASNIRLVARILGGRKHIHLLTAHTPALGLELAATHRPALILLDINMPGMNGYQVLDVLKSDARLKDTPVVAVTANAMPSDIERGVAAGFNDYLTKPIDVRRFHELIDRMLKVAARTESSGVIFNKDREE